MLGCQRNSDQGGRGLGTSLACVQKCSQQPITYIISHLCAADSMPSSGQSYSVCPDCFCCMITQDTAFYLLVRDCVGVMHFLVFLWIPTYYNENYGVDVKQSALLSIFPWCCAIVATMTAGAIADALTSREVLPLTHVRKLMQGIGSFGPAGCLFYLAWLNKVQTVFVMLKIHLQCCNS